MYPGSFIWKTVSDEWLQSNTAATLFAASSVTIIALSAIGFGFIHVTDAGVVSNLLFGVGGVLCAFAIFFLWGGMWRYWLQRDQSSRVLRNLSFIMLTAGIWYGAVLYFLLIYLPAVRKADRASDLTERA